MKVLTVLIRIANIAQILIKLQKQNHPALPVIFRLNFPDNVLDMIMMKNPQKI